MDLKNVVKVQQVNEVIELVAIDVENAEKKNAQPLILPFDFDKVMNMSDEELANFRDHRGFNILLAASEAGHLEAVKHLINCDFNVDYQVDGQSSASLAFANGHHEVVLVLLKANSKMPTNFNPAEVPDGLEEFVNLSTKVHQEVRDGNEDDLKKILTKNPTIRHFYDDANNSALKIAIIAATLSIIKLLVNNSILLGPDEAMEDIQRLLSEDRRTELRKLFETLAPCIFTDTMMALMRNCRFGLDGNRNPDYMHFVSKAFHILLENPLTAPILEIVAATRNFIIIFDFKRESVNFVNPASDQYVNGIFYVSGKIYIGAKDMLDPARAVEITAVMIHELCHYAMYHVYNNMAKPYRTTDRIIKRNFKRICDICKVNKVFDEIVSLVFDEYSSDMYHAELIVRAPQMIVFYQNLPELREKREEFPELFEDYENRVVPFMKKALPRVERKFDLTKEKKVQGYTKLIIFAIIFFGLGLGLASFGFYVSTYKVTDSTIVFSSMEKAFNCKEGNRERVPWVKYCDGVSDCADGSDEKHCVSGEVKKQTFYPHNTTTIDDEDFGIASAHNVERIYARLNKKIKFLPIGVDENFPYLVEFVVSRCSVQKISSRNFKNLKKLVILNLSFNKITSIEAGSFDDLTSLKTLSLAQNRISSLPENILELLNELKIIRLERNQLKLLPAQLFKNNRKLVEIYLGDNQIEEIPSDLFAGLTGLEELWLQDNHISSLPENVFENLNELKEINLGGNQLKSLPAQLFKNNRKLVTISLRDNQIEEIPSNFFAGLTELEEFLLYDNKISNLPTNLLKDLTKLREIDLWSNNLKVLSKEIFQFNKKLEGIELSGNQLEKIDAELFDGMENLKYVDLEGNKCIDKQFGLENSTSTLNLLELKREIKAKCS